MTKEAVYCLVA